MRTLFEYNICNQTDTVLFKQQCLALEAHIPGLQLHSSLEDVDGSIVRTYSHDAGTVKVKNDMQVDALYVTSDFDLTPYFS